MNKTKIRETMGAIGTPVMFAGWLHYGDWRMCIGFVSALFLLFHVEVKDKITEYLHKDN